MLTVQGLVTSAAVLTVVLWTDAAAQNLLRNPDFGVSARLGEWAIYNFPSWDSTDRLSQPDSGSARLYIHAPVGGSEWVSQTVPVTPGTGYVIGTWAKVTTSGLPEACYFQASYSFTGPDGTISGDIHASGEVQGAGRGTRPRLPPPRVP